MPKILQNVREQLLTEAKRQIIDNGYASTTIRSVAGACGLAIGTVYNYFPSKEMLIATFVYEDWKKYLSDMQKLPQDNDYALLKGIYLGLISFANENKKLFSDADALKVIATAMNDRHKLLRKQIASFVLPICNKNHTTDAQFTAYFLAEALICWSMENADFDAVYSILKKIIN